jgi:hypothetical protein
VGCGRAGELTPWPRGSFSLELGKVTVGRLDMLRAVELLVQNRSLVG